VIIVGSLFNEPMRIETVRVGGDGTWTVGLVGTQSERFRKVTLTAGDIHRLTILDSDFSYDGDGSLLRLGLQAYSLGIAYEFDPYFGLSISRVDPLPHQLEAVYGCLLKLAQVRFLLADDAGAGKTIMAGLLIRELQLRGLAERILVVYPANLSFQWQRELKEKFLVLKGGDIRDQFGVNQWMEQNRVITSLDLAKRTEILPGLKYAQELARLAPPGHPLFEAVRRHTFQSAQEPFSKGACFYSLQHEEPSLLEWHEVTKVAHYYLTVNAMTQPMMVREDSPRYGGGLPGEET